MKWMNVDKIKDVVLDKRISLDAKGLFIILNRFVSSFECTKDKLMSYCKNDDFDIHSALMELVAYGYVSKEYLDYYDGEKRTTSRW